MKKPLITFAHCNFNHIFHNEILSLLKSDTRTKLMSVINWHEVWKVLQVLKSFYCNHFVTNMVNLTGWSKKEINFCATYKKVLTIFLEASQKLWLKVTYWNFLMLHVSLLVLHAEQQALIPKINLPYSCFVLFFLPCSTNRFSFNDSIVN